MPSDVTERQAKTSLVSITILFFHQNEFHLHCPEQQFIARIDRAEFPHIYRDQHSHGECKYNQKLQPYRSNTKPQVRVCNRLVTGLRWSHISLHKNQSRTTTANKGPYSDQTIKQQTCRPPSSDHHSTKQNKFEAYKNIRN